MTLSILELETKFSQALLSIDCTRSAWYLVPLKAPDLHRVPAQLQSTMNLAY
jgi:hypothetical protein